VDERLKSVKRVLVRCPNWVGDIVMATPLFRCIRDHFQDARIYAGIRRYARGVIEDSPWFDQIVPCDDRTLPGFVRTVRETRALKPDLAILLPNSTRCFLTARLGGIKRIYGYKRNLQRFFMTGGPEPVRDYHGFKPVPMVDYYLEIGRDLGFHVPPNPRPRLFISSRLRAEGENILKRYGISEKDTLVGLNPGAGFGSSKCWPPEYFARLAELIETRLHCRLILFVGPGEERIADDIVARSRSKIINTARNILDLSQLKPLIKRCNLLVTNDTGPRHYAVAFDVPVVVLMGPTNPAYTSANLERSIVFREDVDCSPCHRKVCPTDHRCMTRILPEKVFEGVEKLLANSV